MPEQSTLITPSLITLIASLKFITYLNHFLSLSAVRRDTGYHAALNNLIINYPAPQVAHSHSQSMAITATLPTCWPWTASGHQIPSHRQPLTASALSQHPSITMHGTPAYKLILIKPLLATYCLDSPPDFASDSTVPAQ